MTWFLSALLYFAVALGPLVQTGAQQTHLSGQRVVAGTSEVDLASITDVESYATLMHPRFPSHQVRVKKTDFCDPTVK